MGVPQGGGVNLGNAQGTISINTTGVSAAASTVKSASAQMTSSMNAVAPAAQAAQKGVSGLATTLKGLAGVAGISVGVAGVALIGQKLLQLGVDSVKAASDLEESLNKINVAFGGSSKAILDWSKNSATALGQSQQQALEAASSFGLLFSTMGLGQRESAEMSKELVQLATDIASINNISPDEALAKLRSGLVGEVEPLRSVGVLLDEATVKAKALAMGLAPSAAALTQQDKVMARYQLILEQTTKTQGDFARTSGGLANQTRILTAHLGDLAAAFGSTLTPAVLTTVGALNDLLGIMESLQNMGPLVELPSWMTADPLGDFLRGNHLTPGGFVPNAETQGPRGGHVSTRAAATVIDPTAAAAFEASSNIHQDWARGMAQVQKDADASMLDEEQSFGQSRAKTVADYAKSVARDEANYARTRLRENLAQLDALAGVAKDATRREQGQAADLARTQGQTRADSAEREADARKDANKRLAELDEDYQRNREKAARHFRDSQLEAAGRLDAVAVAEAQRNFKEQEDDAREAHDDARKDIEAGLQERLDQEAKALDKSLRQQQEAYDRQIAEGRENDALRIQDMKDTFAKQQAQEAEDHAIQVRERAEDQAAQLAEMDTQHGLRMNQIRTHAIEERAALQQAADDAAVAAGVADEATRKRHEAKELEEEKLWDKFHKHIIDSMTPRTLAGGPVQAYASGGYVPSTGLAMLHAGEFVMPRSQVAGGGGGRSTVFSGNVSVTIAGGTNLGRDEMKRVAKEAFMEALQEIAA